MKKNLKMKKITLILFLIVISTVLQSQNIKRRASFGAALVNINDSIAKANKLNNTKGCIINLIVPDGSAESLKLQKGDIITHFNNSEIENKLNFISIVSTLKEGDAIDLTIIRNAKKINVKGKILGAKLDKYDFAEVIYDEVPFENGYLRNILIKPIGNKKFPTLYFIQGYNCASIDNMGENHPYEKILIGLVKNGFAVCKVEKPGMGDGTGFFSCENIDFKTELAAFEKTYNQLEKYNFVNTSSIFIFGHSMGGIIAPLMKTKIQPKGIAVYGTVTRSWFEYFVEQTRIQNFIMGEDYAQNDSAFNMRLKLWYEFMINKKTLEQLVSNPDFAEIIKTQWDYKAPAQMFGRNFLMWQQLQDYSLITGWKNYGGKVLSIWGETDFVAFSRYDHELIADIVNKYHPGKGKFITIPQSDHAFTKTNNLSHAAEMWTNYMYRMQNFNPQIIDVLTNWMNEK